MSGSPIQHAASSRTTIHLGAVWVALIALTLIARLESYNTISRVAATVVLLATMVKIWLVMRYYMEIRTAPTWLKMLCNAWVVAVSATFLAFTLHGA